MDNLQQVQELRKEIKDLKRQLKKYKHLETGSTKSLLNCHPKGKENFKKYINLFYPQLQDTGNFLRRIIEQVEPYSYEDIIGGNF